MKLSKELKAGIIAILAIVGFVVLFQFMKGRNLFTTENVFYAKYDNVEGLKQSCPVSINGLKVGQVDKIFPITEKDGRIHFVVKLIVDDKFQFSKTSGAEIFESGLMSGKEVRINLMYNGQMAKNGDTLQGMRQLSMLNSLSSQVGPVKDQLQVVLHRVDSLMSNANKVMDERNRAEIRALLTNLNKTVSSMENTSGSVNALVSRTNPNLQKMLDNASLATTSAKTTLDKYGNLAESIDTKKLNNTIADLDATVVKLNQTISGINDGQGSLGKLMKDEQLYNNLISTSKSLNSLVEDMKTNPKRYINFSVFGKNNKD